MLGVPTSAESSRVVSTDGLSMGEVVRGSRLEPRKGKRPHSAAIDTEEAACRTLGAC